MPGHVYFYIYAATDSIIGWRWGGLNPGVLKHAHLLGRAILGRAVGYPIPLTVKSEDPVAQGQFGQKKQQRNNNALPNVYPVDNT